MLERIAVMGSGSMGTVLGALLTEQGFPVALVDVNQAHVDALNRSGAVLRGMVERTIPVHACRPEALTGHYDLFFLFTKQYANPAAFGEMEQHLAPGGVVCTLQNGLPEPELAARFGQDRAMGCAVTWAAACLSPGVVQTTTAPSHWSGRLGRLDGLITPQVEEVGAVLNTVFPVEPTTQLLGMRWAKLLINSAFSGVSSALGVTFGGLLTRPAALKAAQYVARECVRVARASGYALQPMREGEYFDRQMFFETEDQRAAAIPLFQELLTASAGSRASMLQDLLAGRRTEVDAINGVVAAQGRRVGVPTPVCDLVIRTIHQAEEAGRAPLPMEHLAEFEPLLV